MKYLILVILLINSSFALSPFSLEGVKNINVKVFDKSKLLSKVLKQRMKKEIIEEFTKLGIQTQTEEFSNFIVKIQAVKIQTTYIVTVNLFIVEDIVPSRDKSLESMGITYKKDDFFTTDNFEEGIYESVIDYLLFDFIEQYKDENS